VSTESGSCIGRMNAILYIVDLKPLKADLLSRYAESNRLAIARCDLLSNDGIVGLERLSQCGVLRAKSGSDHLLVIPVGRDTACVVVGARGYDMLMRIEDLLCGLVIWYS